MDKNEQISHICECGYIFKVVQKDNLPYILAFIRQMRENHLIKLFRYVFELRNLKLNRIADIYQVNGLSYPYHLLNNLYNYGYKGLKGNDLNILKNNYYCYVTKYRERIDYSNQN